MTENEVEVTAIGDRLRQAMDLWRFFQDINLDLPRIQELMSAFWAVRQAGTLRQKMEAGLEVLKLLADVTPTEVDDNIVAVIDKFSDPLLDLLELVVSNFLPSADIRVLDVKIQQQFETAGIPWGMILQIAKLLAQLIGMVKGK